MTIRFGAISALSCPRGMGCAPQGEKRTKPGAVLVCMSLPPAVISRPVQGFNLNLFVLLAATAGGQSGQRQ